MKIALIQTELTWEDASANLNRIEKLIEAEDAEMFVLPEMFASGFTMNTKEVAESMSGKSVLWMKETAKRKDAVIVGSLVIEENNNYYNRMIWVEPDGTLYHYDKRHLFRMANEQEHYSAGKQRTIITYKGIRFCLQVCYDLRFPVWSRNIGENGEAPIYDCLIYVANWPEVRTLAWTSLLQARAIENQCFAIGVNRVGEDGKGIQYSGESRVFSPKGDRIDKIQAHEEMVDLVEINLDELNDFREKFPVSRDADIFTIVNL